MNNFYLNQQDPLLTRPYEMPNPIIYQQMQDTLKDTVGELDKSLKSLSPAMMEELQHDTRFATLNAEFQNVVQQELLTLIKNKLNANSTIILNANRQIEIIDDIRRKVESEKEESINEMNDYIKNYSHLTFDEYKKNKNKNKQS